MVNEATKVKDVIEAVKNLKDKGMQVRILASIDSLTNRDIGNILGLAAQTIANKKSAKNDIYSYKQKDVDLLVAYYEEKYEKGKI